MRGFRGNRAKLNQMTARFGNPTIHSGNHSDTNSKKESLTQNQSEKKTSLPNWLKTPETKAQEKNVVVPIKTVQIKPVIQAKLTKVTGVKPKSLKPKTTKRVKAA